MLAAVGNVGIDRRHGGGTVQEQNEGFSGDSPGWRDPRSAGLFPLALRESSSIEVSFKGQNSATVDKRFHVAIRSCSWPRIGGPDSPMRASGSEEKDDGPPFELAIARDGFTLVKSCSAKGKGHRLALSNSAAMPRGKRGCRRSAAGSRLL